MNTKQALFNEAQARGGTTVNEQDSHDLPAPEWCFDDTMQVESFTELLHETEFGWRAIRTTPLGYVEMRGQRYEKGGGSTSFLFIWNSQVYRRTLTRFYHYALADTLAEAFVRTVVLGKLSIWHKVQITS